MPARMTAVPPSLPYRAGVGAMLLNAAGDVFVGRRIDTAAKAWQMPQGGIDGDETPAQAVARELLEETGIGAARIVAESTGWFAYDLPPELLGTVWGGRYRGQRQKWFLMRFTGNDSDIDIATEHPEFNAWQWLAPDLLVENIVAFKRPLYAGIVGEFTPLIPGMGDRQERP